MKTIQFFSTFLMITMVTSIFGQFSRQQAIDLVISEIVNDVSNKVDVFSKIESETASVFLIDNEEKTNVYNESWVFFIDDNPFASWYHSSRIVFISTSNGDYLIENVSIYPKNLYTDFEEILSVNRPDPVEMAGTAFVSDPEKVSSNYNYALIIVSMDNARNWYNTSLIYNVLTQNYNWENC